MQAVLPNLEEKWSELSLERGMLNSLPGVKEILGLTSYYRPHPKRDTVSLPHCFAVSSEQSLGSRGRRRQETSVLHHSCLNGPKMRYQRQEKLVLAFFIISRKLKHYFKTFPITVLTKHPLGTIMQNLKATKRISK